MLAFSVFCSRCSLSPASTCDCIPHPTIRPTRTDARQGPTATSEDYRHVLLSLSAKKFWHCVFPPLPFRTLSHFSFPLLIQSLHVANPCYFVFLLLPWSLIELPLLCSQADFHPDLLIFGTNSFCIFTLNPTVFLLVVKATALTMNVVDIIKDGLLIAFSLSVIRDTITPINLFGYDVDNHDFGYIILIHNACF
ncbi:hypothetical protein ZIOFF_064923 [Zingiber officinale]|uniref:Uncharacterized protein n=1 Tax=Zingiber officinale TaxID=94328 RepID=A0A8J5K6U2_ZINOF|nr:hypothetical protein ZIOFF_064923 [Zingiber officinale]